jgi:outer membrane protein assembly factor BamB
MNPMNKSAPLLPPSLVTPPRPFWRVLRTLAALAVLGPALACATASSAGTTTASSARPTATPEFFPTLYMGTTCDDHAVDHVLTFDAKTGTPLKAAPVGSTAYGDALVQDNHVYFGTDDGNLAVLAMDSLQQQYHFQDPNPTGGGFTSTAAAAGGWIYVGVGITPINAWDSDAKEPPMLYGLVLRGNGQVQLAWKFVFPGQLGTFADYSRPVVSGNVVYAAGPDGYVYALDRFKGTVLWKFATHGANQREIVASLAVAAPDTVYAHSDDGYIYRIHAGQEQWEVNTNSAGFLTNINSTPLLDKGVIYVGGGPKLYALDAATGQVKWMHPFLWSIQSSPILAGGLLFVGADDGFFYALDATTGATKWKFQTGKNVYSTAAVGNGKVYFGGGPFNRFLYAVSAAAGNLVWQQDISAIVPGCDLNWTSPTLGS